jgi:copper transport protein
MLARKALARGVLRLLMLALAGLALLPAAAAAHALVIASNPAPGARLAVSPPAIEATFSEPLNRSLSRLGLTRADGRPVAVRAVSEGPTRLGLKPIQPLARGVYEVRWHSVSADDGHTAQGTYYFGLQDSPGGHAGFGQAGPFAGAGWLLAVLDAAFNATLIAFCGGIFCSALLAPTGAPAGWLLAEARDLDRAARLWRGTIAVGVLATVTSLLATIADAAHAGGALNLEAVRGYLSSGTAGAERMAVAALLLLSVLAAVRQAPRRAAVLAALALAALVESGHASSARLPALAVGSDLIHLIAASVWLGGIVHIVATWLPRLSALGAAERRRIIAVVLPRFGRIALPAFVILAIAGAIDALTELGSVEALWNQSYGRVLVVKVALVAVIALVSYRHAFRLRPRLVSAGVEEPRLARRHWRLMAIEPILAVGVASAAALLIAYAPPVDLAAPRTARVRPALSVAEQAGPYIVNAQVSERGIGASLELRTLDALERPTAIAAEVPGAVRTGSCGDGCTRLELARTPRALTVELTLPHRRYRATLPIRYQPSAERVAQRLLGRVESAVSRLRSVAIRETLQSGQGAAEVTSYELSSPDRFAFQLSRGGRPVSEATILGDREWTRDAGHQAWQLSRYGGGGPPFSTATYLAWWMPYASHPQLLGRSSEPGRDQADIATVSRLPGLGAVWLRLRIDLTHSRVTQIRMITTAHFMTQTWSAFNAPEAIESPTSGPIAHP